LLVDVELTQHRLTGGRSVEITAPAVSNTTRTAGLRTRISATLLLMISFVHGIEELVEHSNT
jgi:hypothetical protein